MDKQKPMSNRIHIIGSVGSGKTTLARILSDQLNIPYFELDNIFWERRATGDVKRTEQDRDEYLSKIISSESWIIEGVHHQWGSPCLQNADLILFLDVNLFTRSSRIIKRFLMQKLGIEKANYRPTLKILKDLYKYNTVFENKSKPEIFAMLGPHKNKLIILKNNIEMINYIDLQGQI